MNEQQAPQLTDEEVVKSYLQDEKVSKNLRVWADHLQQRFHGNWFTKERIVKKTSMKTLGEADQLVTLLILKGHLIQKKFDNEIRYKVTLDPAERVRLLQEHLADAEKTVANIKASIEVLEAQIASSNKN